MARIKFARGLQTQFCLAARERLGVSWSELSKKIKVHPRCLSDWCREKYTIPDFVFGRLVKLMGKDVSIPSHEVLPDFWGVAKAAKKGGMVVAQKYGGPGTQEGRRRGGVNSQIQRKLCPELYQHCNIRKTIKKPPHCVELAEFIGIVLGDGGMHSNFQVIITLHREHDREYAQFVYWLATELFAVKPVIYKSNSIRKHKVIEVVLNGANIVEFLLLKGLLRGNKVKRQVDVPHWIKENLEFSTACLRGLVDTDGGVFSHKHSIRGRDFFNVGLKFSNMSKPLLWFVRDTLLALGFIPTIDSRHVNLYKEGEVIRYMEEVKFSNPYHDQRLKQFIEQKKEFLRRGA